MFGVNSAFSEKWEDDPAYSYAPWDTNLLVNVICFQRLVSTSGTHKAIKPQFQCLGDYRGRFGCTESNKTLDSLSPPITEN